MIQRTLADQLLLWLICKHIQVSSMDLYINRKTKQNSSFDYNCTLHLLAVVSGCHQGKMQKTVDMNRMNVMTDLPCQSKRFLYIFLWVKNVRHIVTKITDPDPHTVSEIINCQHLLYKQDSISTEASIFKPLLWLLTFYSECCENKNWIQLVFNRKRKGSWNSIKL